MLCSVDRGTGATTTIILDYNAKYLQHRDSQNCRYTYTVSYLSRLFLQLKGAILFTSLASELLLRGVTGTNYNPTFLTQMDKTKEQQQIERKN